MASEKPGLKGHKRRKLNNGTSAKSRKAAAKGISTRLDALPWKSFSMPDKLDDYEGFMGLEEVDDVEVVRDSTGQVTYLSKHGDQPKAEQLHGKSGKKSDEPVAAVDDRAQDSDSDDGGPEWNGFETDDAPKLGAKQSKGQSQSEKEKKAKTTPKTTSKSAAPDAKPSLSGFEALASVDDADSTDVSAWMPFKLSPDTMASLARLKFTAPSQIQKAAIPEILALHDVIGKAPTGSGKTLAFGIPILERFLELRGQTRNEAKIPLALILSPTRELAHQLDKHLTALCSNGLFDGPSIATLTGGLSVQKQQRQLKNADIVIGTPGRLWEVMSSGQGTVDALKKIQFLVVDEADRLLSEGHFKEVEEIVNSLDRVEEELVAYEETSAAPVAESAPKSDRQTLVFSATFDRGLQTKLATRQKITRSGNNLMDNAESLEYLLSKLPFREEEPKFIDVNPINQLASGLREGLVECGALEKDLYLYALLLLNSSARTLVFTNSISAVRRITPLLQMLDIPALALHSGMPQKARLRSVERFTQHQKKRQGTVLIATDVAARGLDIPNVQLVIHYHLPRAADTYVHRSGRTARAGAPGSSVLLCGPEEVAGVRRLVAKVHALSAAGIAADENASEAKRQGFFIRTLDLDRRIVGRLKPRAKLAKQIADATIAKEKAHRQDDFFRAAAEELGVDYDSEELEQQDTGKRGRGAGRKKKEREARALSKDEVGALKAELKRLLKERVNVGVSERYLTGGNVDVDELLRQKAAGEGKTGEFLGRMDGMMGLEDL